MSKIKFVEFDSPPYERSSKLKANLDLEIKKYKEKRKEYNFNGISVNLGDGKLYTLDRNKFDLGKLSNINVGWKIHLNVNLNNVTRVSDFLIKEGFLHKYLYGGDPSEGKVFTVYLGSWEMMTKYTSYISKTIGNFLCVPKAEGELEFEPGIVGRFTVIRGESRDEIYHQYGKYGVPYTNKLALRVGKGFEFSSFEEELKFHEETFAKLNEEFGEYFVNLKQASFR